MRSKFMGKPYCCTTSVLTLCCALALAMSGCDSKTAQAPQPVAPVAQSAPAINPAPVPAGIYLNKKYPKDSFELKKDGTFLIKEGKKSLSGKYDIQDNQLTFALPDGSGSICNFDENGITDSAGELWTKQ